MSASPSMDNLGRWIVFINLAIVNNKDCGFNFQDHVQGANVVGG
jgi:hypothetical protein